MMNFDQIIGSSTVLREALQPAILAATCPTDSTVLLLGETGVGKGLVAKAIHLASARSAEGRFIGVNCAGIPAPLVESELFGHVKGAFTDAVRDREGKFQQANRGTLFLDEIGDLAKDAQAKILKALEEGVVQKVGAVNDDQIDVRIVAATHRNLKKDIDDGLFRLDLYQRLNVVLVSIPALHERKDDIPVLAESFLEKFGTKADKDIAGFTGAAMELCKRYQWTGNVRELENAIHHAVIMCPNGEPIDIKHLPPDIRKTIASSYPASSKTHARVTEQNPDPLVIQIYGSDGKFRAEADILNELLFRSIETTRGNKTQAAKLLGVSLKTLHNRLAALERR
jgi:two-component system, NtrC family, response regulator HydG